MSDSPNSGKINDEELIGELFDEKYRITAKLGGGGMGLVYEAQHEWMERRVALKVLRPNFIHAEDYAVFLERFKREAQTASRINHPNAVTIYDFGIYKQMPYLAMQFIEGSTISDMIKSEGPMSEERATVLIRQVLDAVSAAHALQIIHRDIKPENIMLSNTEGRENVHVLDFGIAKVLDSSSEANATMTQPGKAVGTPRYMSPEQVLARPIDARTDIYALGLVLYEMLSGDIPFKADSSMQLMFHHVNTAPLPIREVNAVANVSKGIEKLIMKALQKDADKRFQSISEMQQALETLTNRPTRRTSMTLSSVPTLPAERRKTALLLAGSFTILALLLAAVVVWKQQATDQEEAIEVAKLATTDVEQQGQESSAALEKDENEIESSDTADSLATTGVEGLSSDADEIKAADQAAAVASQGTTEEMSEASAAKSAASPDDGAFPSDSDAEVASTAASAQGLSDPGAKDIEVANAADSGAERSSIENADDIRPLGTIPEATPSESADEEMQSAGETATRDEAGEETSTQATDVEDTIVARSDEAPSPASLPEPTVTPESRVAPKVTPTPNSSPPTDETPATKPQAASKVVSEPKVSEQAKTTEVESAAERTAPADPQSTAALIAQLAAEDRTLREKATIALQQRGKEPVPLLIQTLRSNESPRARFLAVFILGKLRATEATDAIIEALRDDSPMVQETAKKALLAVNPARAERVLGVPAPSTPENRKEPEREGLFGLF